MPYPRRASPAVLLIAPIKLREPGRNASRSLPVREIQDSKRVAIIPSELSTTAMRLKLTGAGEEN
jgi:hypothetical protein